MITLQVADCILLMSLDKPEAIPVDTHMFQIAANQVCKTPRLPKVGQPQLQRPNNCLLPIYFYPNFSSLKMSELKLKLSKASSSSFFFNGPPKVPRCRRSFDKVRPLRYVKQVLKLTMSVYFLTDKLRNRRRMYFIKMDDFSLEAKVNLRLLLDQSENFVFSVPTSFEAVQDGDRQGVPGDQQALPVALRRLCRLGSFGKVDQACKISIYTFI
jgi:hypothetical protein